MPKQSRNHLRRYMDVPSLLYLLSEKVLTLLDPQSWDDHNDSYYLELYKNKKKLRCVLAACFSESNETYHHWKIFAGGSGGVCIQFNRRSLLAAVRDRSGIRMASVQYLTLAKAKKKRATIWKLPFLKRYAFGHESEFRIIYESPEAEHSTLDIPIPLSCIDKVTLSPWIAPSLSKCLKARIRTINGCEKLEIVRSTLIDNSEWKRIGEEAT